MYFHHVSGGPQPALPAGYMSNSSRTPKENVMESRTVPMLRDRCGGLAVFVAHFLDKRILLAYKKAWGHAMCMEVQVATTRGTVAGWLNMQRRLPRTTDF